MRARQYFAAIDLDGVFAAALQRPQVSAESACRSGWTWDNGGEGDGVAGSGAAAAAVLLSCWFVGAIYGLVRCHW